MKPKEAIKVKEQYHEKYKVHMLSKEKEADQLSIEALKRLQEYRTTHVYTEINLLPGETKE